jgi:hypothetical protein
MRSLLTAPLRTPNACLTHSRHHVFAFALHSRIHVFTHSPIPALPHSRYATDRGALRRRRHGVTPCSCYGVRGHSFDPRLVQLGRSQAAKRPLCRLFPARVGRPLSCRAGGPEDRQGLLAAQGLAPTTPAQRMHKACGRLTNQPLLARPSFFSSSSSSSSASSASSASNQSFLPFVSHLLPSVRPSSSLDEPVSRMSAKYLSQYFEKLSRTSFSPCA